MKKYAFKEIYYTLQGEGLHAGRAAIFARFSGCNLWSGLEKDREFAICQFCDTDFWGVDGENGGKYNSAELIDIIRLLWPHHDVRTFIVFTGGEPALQLDQALVDTLHQNNIEIAIETNGTLELPKGIDWITVSPKSGTELKLKAGNELKLVYPQDGQKPEDFQNYNFDNWYLQPMDSEGLQEKNTALCIDYCLRHPQWKLSVQTHKILGLK